MQRNDDNRVVLYDTDELITAKIENFKDGPAVLTMIQHIPGQWDMEKCNMKYKRKNASTLEFEIKLPARTESGPAASWSACLVAAAQRLQGSYSHERELYQYKQTINS